MNKIFAIAVLASAVALGGCATAEVDATKTGSTAKPGKDQNASPKEEREAITGSRLPRRDS